MLSLSEPLQLINHRLKDYFGVFENGEPNWKLFWSEDMLEKRMMNSTENGVILALPEPRLVKKANYLNDCWVLCRIVPVPECDKAELCGAKTSYEPICTFDHPETGEPMAPDWDIIHATIKVCLENMANAGHKAPEQIPEEMRNTREAIEYRVNKKMEEMFGNETKIGDSLALDSAVGFGTRKRNDWLN